MAKKKCGKKRRLIPLISALVTSFLVISSGFAYAGCLQDGGTLKQSLDCTALPTIDKYYQPKTFQWGSFDILVVNRGNELSWWKLVNPASPTPIPGVVFNMGHQGDSDHDLTTYSICEGCQFGVASYKRGTVVFDMGTGSIPSIGNKFSKYLSTNSRLAFTYRNGNDQYIISKDLPGANYKVTIFKVVAHNNIVRVRDFPVPPGTMMSPVSGGFDFSNRIIPDNRIMLNINGTFYIYRKDGDNLVFIRNTGVKATMGFYDSAADSGPRLVTGEQSTSSNGLKLWDFNDPAYPVLLFTYPGKYRAVGFNGRHIITSTSAGAIKTFSVDNDTIVPMDWEFWNPDNPWNDWPDACTTFLGATFSNNGNWSYIVRLSVFQKINFSGCGGSQPTPTPTPPAWPTPRPTCVPGCTSTEYALLGDNNGK